MGKFGDFIDKLNEKVNNSVVDKFFSLKERGSNLTTELRAGTVTFLTMAYILAVNAAIVADTGGPCTIDDCAPPNTGVPFCMFGTGSGFDPGFMACREEAKRSMTTATAVGSFVACFIMGAFANLPFALAPGMGMNAFFTYTVVGFFGVGGMLTYQQALAAVFIEGWIFVLIAISGLRGRIVQAMPKCVMLATAGGIGLFLAFIGLQGAEGLGLVTYEPATLVTLGGCKPEDRTHMYSIKDVSSVCVTDANGTLVSGPNVGPMSPNYGCNSMRMRSATTWLGISGGILMVLMMGRGFRGAIMYAILFVTFISWIEDHEASYFDDSPLGMSRRAYFDKVVVVPDTSFTDLEIEWNAFGRAELWAVLFSFLYLDFLDSTGTFFSMANFINKKMGGRFINPMTKDFPRCTAAYAVDGTATWIGALLGIPPITTYIESATGIREGGRTGITAIVVSLWFGIAMFFTPILASIPPWATGPALMLVGCLMMENLLDIEWKDPQQAVPAFLTIAIIPLTYSIAFGIIAGIVTYMALYLLWLLYDLATCHWTGKSPKELLKAAKPDAFMNEAELIAQDVAYKRKHKELAEEDAMDPPSGSDDKEDYNATTKVSPAVQAV